jgi:hypothetical protein
VELDVALAKLIASGFMGIGAFFLVNAMPIDEWLAPVYARWPWTGRLSTFIVRTVAYLISAAFGAVPVALQVLMRYVPQPADWRAWVEVLFPVVFIAIVTGQAAHAVEKGIVDYSIGASKPHPRHAETRCAGEIDDS